MSNRISVIIDVAVDKANTGIKSFTKSIKDADGAAGKFKAGAGAALDSVKANAGNLAMAGGAALVGFGVKAVSAFQNTAIEAGKMSDALGIPVEDMSRLIEVAGDLGIETATLETSIGKMNVTAGKTPAALEAIGAELVKNADGTTNVNATFLSTVEALKKIPDATARAAAAQKIFGKGWKDMAELIELGADGIASSMAQVSDAKVIDDDEVRKAREYRAAMDNLSDALEDVMLIAGEALVPALTETADGLIAVKSGIEGVNEVIPEWTGGLGGVYDALMNAITPTGALDDITDGLNETFGHGEDKAKGFSEMLDKTTEAIDETTEATDSGRSSHEMIADSIDNATSSTDTLRRANKALRDDMNDRSGLLSLQNSLEDLKVKQEEAWYAAASGADNAARAARDAELAQIDVKQELMDYVTQLEGVPASTQTEILALIDQGKLAEAEAALSHLMRPRTIAGILQIQGGSTDGRGPKFAGATGGIVTQPTIALIGEAGPEAVVPLNTAPGASPLRANDGAAPTINLTVNGWVGNDQDLVKKLAEAFFAAQRNGMQMPWGS